MERHASALKRARQSPKRHARNRSVLSGIKNLLKKLNTTLATSKKDEARLLLKKSVSAFDRAATKGVIHSNTAARKVSRLTLKVEKALSSDKTS